MAEENKVGKPPKYTGDGVAVWENQDKNGKTYISIKIAGHNVINAFLYEKKEEGDKTPSISPLKPQESKVSEPSILYSQKGNLPKTPSKSDSVLPSTAKQQAYKEFLHKKASLEEKKVLGMITEDEYHTRLASELDSYMNVN